MNIDTLRVDGGAVNNNFLMQFQSDILQLDVELAKLNESTALGAAYLAGLATNFWTNLDEVQEMRSSKKTFNPEMDDETSQSLYSGWQKAVNATRLFK